ncbi:MAG: phosphatidylglycerophosphatase A [Paracoccaceae bacterium]|nr:phosphatidylglycerophosphatase A [Paracoccaceae bacterium]
MRGLFLSFLGAGHLRPAPGTWGSLAALPAAWLLHHLGGPLLLAFLTAAFYGLAVRLISLEMRETGIHDPSWIVIDEVVGQWIALLPVSIGAAHAGVSVTALWPGIVSAFLLFRLFDIWKPWLVGRADARDDATGVVLDDVWAGVFAAIGVVILAVAAHAGMAL